MTLLKSMFVPNSSQLKTAWASLANSAALVGSSDAPFSVLTDLGTGITLSTGQFTIPAGTWVFFFVVCHTWTGNGVPAGSRWSLYNITDAAFVTPSTSYYSLSQAGYQSTATINATLNPWGMAYLTLSTAKVYTVRLQNYLHTPGVVYAGALGGTGGSAICGTLIINMDP